MKKCSNIVIECIHVHPSRIPTPHTVNISFHPINVFHTRVLTFCLSLTQKPRFDYSVTVERSINVAEVEWCVWSACCLCTKRGNQTHSSMPIVPGVPIMIPYTHTITHTERAPNVIHTPHMQPLKGFSKMFYHYRKKEQKKSNAWQSKLIVRY